jgi:ketosteroid isomerase-like protein
MGIQEDAAVVRRGYEAFNSGDIQTLQGLFAPDAVDRVGGSGGLEGLATDEGQETAPFAGTPRRFCLNADDGRFVALSWGRGAQRRNFEEFG